MAPRVFGFIWFPLMRQMNFTRLRFISIKSQNKNELCMSPFFPPHAWIRCLYHIAESTRSSTDASNWKTTSRWVARAWNSAWITNKIWRCRKVWLKYSYGVSTFILFFQSCKDSEDPFVSQVWTHYSDTILFFHKKNWIKKVLANGFSHKIWIYDHIFGNNKY